MTLSEVSRGQEKRVIAITYINFISEMISQIYKRV